MPIDVLIRGGSVVREDGVRVADVAIAEGLIAEIAPGIAGAAREEIDAAGMHIFPGVIDPHVHFNEPGRTEWEGIATGSAALAAGGGTCFFDMPLNSLPVLDVQAFDAKLLAAQNASRTDFALWGGLTPVNLDRLEELAERGVVGFKAFMCNSGIDDFPAADDWTLYRGMQVAARLGLPVAVHAESEAITAGMTRQIRGAGGKSMRDFFASRPVIAEVEAIRRAISIARDTGCSLHIVHVSSWQGVAEVVEARQSRAGGSDRRLDVTCETCPHYLLLDEDEAERIGARAKCAPPVRDAENRRRLASQLAGGLIDLVGSDHSPSPPGMKAGEDMFAVWGGIAGVQATLSALFSLESPLPVERVAHLTAGSVASRFGIARKGRIERGYDADLALVDVGASFELACDDLLDRHRQSPYVGRTFRGIVRRTLLRGQTVFAHGQVNAAAHGRFVRPAR